MDNQQEFTKSEDLIHDLELLYQVREVWIESADVVKPRDAKCILAQIDESIEYIKFHIQQSTGQELFFEAQKETFSQRVIKFLRNTFALIKSKIK